MHPVRPHAKHAKHLLLTALFSAILSACGGGNDEASPPPPMPDVPADPTLADCFGLSAGTAYTMTDPDGGSTAGKVLVVNETFDGTARNGLVEFAGATDTRSAVTYWSPESNGIRFWGELDYDETGTAQTKVVHSAEFLLPLTLQVGQSTVLKYTDTSQQLTGAQAGQTDTQALAQQWTFQAFDTVTLGGKTFTNTCRMQVIDAMWSEDGPTTLWFAKGFGVIHVRHTNSAGQVVEESTLNAVTAQP